MISIVSDHPNDGPPAEHFTSLLGLYVYPHVPTYLIGVDDIRFADSCDTVIKSLITVEVVVSSVVSQQFGDAPFVDQVAPDSPG